MSANEITEAVLAFIGACTLGIASGVGFYELVLRRLPR